MTHSEVYIQRVHFEPEAPVLIDLVLPKSRNEHGNLECEKGQLIFFSVVCHMKNYTPMYMGLHLYYFLTLKYFHWSQRPK